MKSKKRFVSIAGLAVTLGAANAFGALTLIPEITGDAASVTMDGRAITPDGQFVVGNSGSGRGYLYSVASGTSVNVISSDNAQSTTATGVGYRTSGGNTELLVAGLTSSGPTEWMTTNGGTSWGIKRRNATLSLNTMGPTNQLGSQLGTDVYYVSNSRTSATNQPVYLSKGSGAWVATVTFDNKGISGGDTALMNGVSAIGRAVGRRGTGSATDKAYVLDSAVGTPSNYFINTLHDATSLGTTMGELNSVSQDGTAIFGRSFLTGTTGDRYAFKTTLTGFGPGTQGAVNALPELPGTGGSTTRTIAYGASPTGRYAAGMDYTGVEMATLWDTGDPNPANWTAIDLTNYAAAHGVLDGWVRLSRAYSVGVDGSGIPVVTGVGVWSPDGGTTQYTRAYILQVPEPTTIGLLAIGSLMMLRRRRAMA